MVSDTYDLEFDGYWPKPNISGIPAQSGIYCVYACKYDTNNRTVSLKRLIYIGESNNVQERISGHEKWSAWQCYLAAGEQLCFNFAPISYSRVRVEAACIYKHNPPENTEYVDTFPFDRATVTTSGCKKFLKSQFTVYRTKSN